MNILYATGMHSTKYGGIERFLVKLTHELHSKEDKIILQYESLPSNQDFVSDIHNEGGTIVVIRSDKNPVNCFIKILKCIRENNINIIHTNFGAAKFICVLAGLLLRVPKIISHYHDISTDSSRTGSRSWFISRFSNINIAPTRAVRDNIIFNGGPPSNTHVLYHGIYPPPPMGNKKDTCALLNLEYSPLIITSVAWDDPIKGVDLLLDAFYIVSKQFENARLWIVGSACDNKEYLKKARTLGIEDRVLWTGIRSDVPVLMDCCDVYVQPSRSEAFSLTVAEAMAAGKPVAAFRVGGLPEVINDGVTGILAEPENPSSLSDAIIKMLEDPGLRKSMGAAGRDRVARLFNIDKEIRQLLAWYRNPLPHRVLPSPFIFKWIYRMSHWIFINILSLGKASKVHYIDPAVISYGQTPESQFDKKSTFLFARSGNWDKNLIRIEDHFLFKSLENRFQNSSPWQDTILYKQAITEIENGIPYRGAYLSKEDLSIRFDECDALFNDIKDNGIKSNRELYKNGKIDNILSLLDEITVNIDRNGELILNDGWHRFVIARLLELPRIPVRILVRHSGAKKNKK